MQPWVAEKNKVKVQEYVEKEKTKRGTKGKKHREWWARKKARDRELWEMQEEVVPLPDEYLAIEDAPDEEQEVHGGEEAEEAEEEYGEEDYEEDWEEEARRTARDRARELRARAAELRASVGAILH